MADLSAEQRDREKKMIDDPMRWPMMVLPMKNSTKGGPPEVGFLAAGMTWGPNPERPLTLGSIYSRPEEIHETITFMDTDALLDAGWRVD